jgi:hypothetical protein
MWCGRINEWRQHTGLDYDNYDGWHHDKCNFYWNCLRKQCSRRRYGDDWNADPHGQRADESEQPDSD